MAFRLSKMVLFLSQGTHFLTASQAIFGSDSLQSAAAASMRFWHQLELASSLESAVFADSTTSRASRHFDDLSYRQFFGYVLPGPGSARRHSIRFATVGEKMHLSIDSPTLAPRAVRSSKTVFVIGLRAGFFNNRSRSEILSTRNRPFVASVFLRSHSIRHFLDAPAGKGNII